MLKSYFVHNFKFKTMTNTTFVIGFVIFKSPLVKADS